MRPEASAIVTAPMSQDSFGIRTAPRSGATWWLGAATLPIGGYLVAPIYARTPIVETPLERAAMVTCCLAIAFVIFRGVVDRLPFPTDSVGIDPIQFSVVFPVGASIGFITPPYGLNLYVASGVTGAPTSDCRAIPCRISLPRSAFGSWWHRRQISRCPCRPTDRTDFMPGDGSRPETKGRIPTDPRLLLLLEEVAKRGTPVLPSTLADALELPKPKMYRLLATAEEQGFLQRDVDGRSFGPGRRLRELASNTLSSQRIRTERLAIAKHLAETVGETCNLSAPGRSGMVYLGRVETHWPLRIQSPIGTQVPFHCTASGKMYLSSLRSDKLDRLPHWFGLGCCHRAFHSKRDGALRGSKSGAVDAAMQPTTKSSWRVWSPWPCRSKTAKTDFWRPFRSMHRHNGTRSQVSR